MRRCEEAPLSVIEAENIAIEAGDINRTGLTGPEWTPLTTSAGIRGAKRTSLKPNGAALLLRYFKGAGLKADDRAAVGASGLFPGLRIATLCAATELDLQTEIVAAYAPPCMGRRARK